MHILDLNPPRALTGAFYNSVAKVLDSLLWKQPIFIQLNYQEKWYDMNNITYTEEKAILWKENKANM